MVDRCSAAIGSAFIVFLEIPSYLDSLTRVAVFRQVYKLVDLSGKKIFNKIISTVSRPLDRSKRFTLCSPGRPVHSDTNSASLGSILVTQQLRAKIIQSHFHRCL